MASKLNQPWIPLERIENLVQVEPGLVILGLAIISILFYKVFLKTISQERHLFVKRLFTNIGYHLTGWICTFFTFVLLRSPALSSRTVDRFAAYIGLLALLAQATVFIKISRILVYEYLFFKHMREGVPVLLVNLFTLLLTIFMVGWIGTDVFSIKLAPLLATSAVFSLVLGLALQDTLGNLFSGVALQFDKPYEIGDWVEVQNGGQKIVGQIYEISWRATVLIAFSEEVITIPNRVMAQAQISNFSAKLRPFCRGLTFRLCYGAPVEKAKAIVLKVASEIPAIRRAPPPLAMVTEAGESWVLLRLVYYIEDYGNQYIIGDKVLKAVLHEFEEAGITLASPRIVVQDGTANAPAA